MTPMPIMVEITGMPVMSANAWNLGFTPESSTPPPDTITGRLLFLIASTARFTWIA